MPDQLSAAKAQNHTFHTNHVDQRNLSAEVAQNIPKLSMNSITTFQWSLSEDVTCYSEFGFQGIGLWLPKINEFGEERAIEILQDSNLDVSSLSWVGGFTGANGYSFQEAVFDARQAIQLASQVDAESLVVVSGARSGHTSRHARRLLTTALNQLAPIAEQHGLRLAVLPMHSMFESEWTFINTIDETLDVLCQIDQPSVGMVFDVFQLWQEPSLIERIPELVPYTTSVQLSDCHQKVKSQYDRCLPGEGEIPLEDIINSFVENGFDGFFDIQVWSERLWNSDYSDLLNRCRSAFTSLCVS